MNAEEYSFDAIIIGAGVVGLSVALELAQSGRKVLVLEKCANAGLGLSSRNSGVIHAGIYYDKAPLKKKHSRLGNKLLYAFCNRYNVPYKKCGKYVVAPAPDDARLMQLFMRNQEQELELIAPSSFRRKFPAIAAKSVLYSPNTGIIDVTSFLERLEWLVHEAEGLVLYNFKVADILSSTKGYRIVSEDKTYRIKSRIIINCTGLDATNHSSNGYSIKFCKGNYFKAPKLKFDTLIYPLPEEQGLGIHLTIDMNNNVRFGPDVEWIDKENYQVDPKRRESFYKAIETYFPGIRTYELSEDYCGIRPKLFDASGNQVHDFIIDTNIDGNNIFINLLGIESPGLTSCLSLAREVIDRINQ